MGSALHFAIQIPSVIKSNLTPKVALAFREFMEVLQVIKHSIPRTLNYSFNSLTIFILIGFAAHLADGSVTILSFSEDMRSAPIALIGAAYSVAIFPTISNLFANNKIIEMRQEIKSVTRRIIFLIFPITVFALILREPIVTLLLGGGNFDSTDILITQGVFGVLMLSVVAWVFMLILARIFYATGKKSPFLISSVMMILTIIFGYLLTFNMLDINLTDNIALLFGVPAIGNPIFELALVRVVADLVGLGLFLIMFTIVFKFNLFADTFILFRNQIIATVIASISLYYTFIYLDGMVESVYINSVISLVISSIVGFGVWLGVLLLFKDAELNECLSKIKFIDRNYKMLN